ncbi:DUF6907 domain-containing protein [Tsukamurella tyrosinosolvens]|uniref:DUF6907 domain-containing protein n=1 Tax=Tsukamurella tyrosinosolvens TaxID=57704 RepID=UPI000DF6F848|nr:hypothetical protein [Tsukamurella tyrosinosolvens]RDB49355.1 hypothetical protein DVB87_03230 [Tsukamurella tyrosinosolvens]
MISPRVCEPWCVDGTGHQNGAVGRSDQVCVSDPTPVALYLEEPEPQRDGLTWFTPHVSTSAIGRFNEFPAVGLYINVLDDRHGEIDRELILTAAEARQLAAGLARAADLIDRPTTAGASA